MSGAFATRTRQPRLPIAPALPAPLPDCAAILAALPMPAVVLDAEDRFRYANQAAELFFHLSFATLAAMRLGDLLPPDSRLFALLAQVRQHEAPVSDHDLRAGQPAAEPPRRRRAWRAAAGDAGRRGADPAGRLHRADDEPPAQLPRRGARRLRHGGDAGA